MAKNQQAIAAKAFAEHWKGKGYEKGESQSFWIELIQTVLGVERPFDIISFENQVNSKGWDAFLQMREQAASAGVQDLSLESNPD